MPGGQQDGVLGEETAQRRTTDERQITGGEGKKSELHPAAQAAHPPDILLVMQHVNDRTGGEEEERLEKSVSKEVEHRRTGRRQTNRRDHVTELGERRIGEDPLDVVLLRGNERGENRGDDADPRNDLEGGWLEPMSKKTRASM